MLYAGRYIYLLFLLASGLLVASGFADLPNPVPIHFGLSGQPDAWASPAAYLGILSLLGILLPLAVVAFVTRLAHRSPEMLNLPNREARLAPEHRQEAARRIGLYIWWFPVLLLNLVLDVHFLILSALTPGRLSLPGLVLTMAWFLGCLIVWIVGWSRVLRFG